MKQAKCLKYASCCRVSGGDTTFPGLIRWHSAARQDRPGGRAVGFGGVHGLESHRQHISCWCICAACVHRLNGDQILQHELQSAAGIHATGQPWRHVSPQPRQPAGCDLMRNASGLKRERCLSCLPDSAPALPLPWWYRRAAGAPMQMESQALCDLVETELLSRSFSLALDCHSGLGLQDRLWFPYASSRTDAASGGMHAPDQPVWPDLPASPLPDRTAMPAVPDSTATYGITCTCVAATRNRAVFAADAGNGSWMWVKKKPAPAAEPAWGFSIRWCHTVSSALRATRWLNFCPARPAAGVTGCRTIQPRTAPAGSIGAGSVKEQQ